MIDRRLALGAPTVEASSAWSADDVILYQLALGAGARPDDQREVRYVHEDRLVVLPTFAAVAASTASTLAIRGPGLDLDLRRVLHVEQELDVFRAVPPVAEVTNRARVESIEDRGRDARIVVAVETTLADGGLLATNRFHLLARGEGGEGGDGGDGDPQAIRKDRHAATADGPPDLTVVTTTMPQQAAWFRLCSDRTPVHVDPAAAAAAGLPRPPLQGLCTWGVIGKMLIDRCLDGDGSAVRRYRARFTGMVFPGETLESQIRSDGRTIAAEVTVRERGTRAMSAVLEV